MAKIKGKGMAISNEQLEKVGGGYKAYFVNNSNGTFIFSEGEVKKINEKLPNDRKLEFNADGYKASELKDILGCKDNLDVARTLEEKYGLKPED